MTRLLLISVALAGLGGCAIAPSPAEPGWADALLAEAPPAEPPAAVNTSPLPEEVRRELLASAVSVQVRGRTIRLTGAALRAPTLDTADFVVEARERARPPEPR